MEKSALKDHKKEELSDDYDGFTSYKQLYAESNTQEAEDAEEMDSFEFDLEAEDIYDLTVF